MQQSPDPGWDTNERTRLRIRLADLEADLAYFQARLEILGEPETPNQLAQRKLFKLLHKSLGEMVLKAKRRMVQEG